MRYLTEIRKEIEDSSLSEEQKKYALKWIDDAHFRGYVGGIQEAKNQMRSVVVKLNRFVWDQTPQVSALPKLDIENDLGL